MSHYSLGYEKHGEIKLPHTPLHLKSDESIEFSSIFEWEFFHDR